MAFKLKSGNKISFKNMGSSPAKTSGHTAPAADGHQHLTNEQSLAAANRRKEEGISKRMSKYNIDKKKATELWTKQNPPLPQPKSPAKTHKPGHKEVDYDKRKEELLNQGFTQKDADKMIESGAVTGKVDVESYKDRMERLSKKYNKSPKEVNKILKSKDYKEGRTKIHSPNKHVTGTTHTHDDLPKGYERGKTSNLKDGGTMTVIKKKEEKKKVYAPGETRIIKSGDKEYTYTPPKKKKSKRSKVKRTKRPKVRKVKNLVTGGYNIIR